MHIGNINDGMAIEMGAAHSSIDKYLNLHFFISL